MPLCKAADEGIASAVSGFLFHWYHCVKPLLSSLHLPTLHDQLAANNVVRTDISTRAAVASTRGKLSGRAFSSTPR